MRMPHSLLAAVYRFQRTAFSFACFGVQGLVGFVNLMRSHPRAVAEHRALVLACLSDDDVTIRTRALELLSGEWRCLCLLCVMCWSVSAYFDTGSYLEWATWLQNVPLLCSRALLEWVSDGIVLRSCCEHEASATWCMFSILHRYHPFLKLNVIEE